MPWIKVHERCNEVKTKCGRQSNNNDTTTSVGASKETLEEVRSTVGLEASSCDTVDSQVHRQDNQVSVDQTENDERYEVGKLGTLRSVTKCENKLRDQESKIEIFQNGVDDWCRGITEWPTVFVGAWIICIVALLRSSNQVHNNGSGQPERCQHEPGEEHTEHVV